MKAIALPARGPVLLSLVVALLAAGCSHLKPPTSAAAAPAAAPAPAPVAAASGTGTVPGAATPAASPARPDPAAPKAFDEVVKGATAQPGFVPLWRKDEKLWLEIPLAQLDQPFLFSVNIGSSVGERGLYASQMGPSWLASFRRTGSQQIQLIALNTNYAADGAAMQATVAQAFSHSLLASAAIVSAPHPERQSVLIDGAFLLADIPGYSTRLERAFRLPFSLDRANSFFDSTRASPELSTMNARVHFATPRLPAPPLTPSPVPTPPPPETPPDPRSFFVGYVYNFSKLPDQPMVPRLSDPRIGHFFDVVTNLSNDLEANPRRHLVNRWRLEKKDPQAALSPPVQPIVYWLDKNIPPRYRAAVTAGVLEWNKAFERLGFKGAIEARQQPDDADWDNMDARHASIRWFVGADVGFAIGPSHTDPRTGEILDADIGMSDVFGRGSRRFIVEDVKGLSAGAADPSAASSAPAAFGSWQALGMGRNSHAFCNHLQEAAGEMNFVLDVLEARGDIAPDSPQAEAFVQSVIKDTIMHEVGHTLGLKHNFKASTTVSRSQLQDKAFTENQGISGSVMDYNAYNLATVGEAQASYNNSTLGPYDYWAIEYAYRPFAPAEEPLGLGRIAARSSEPQLAFADDSDAGGIPGNDGIDPLVNRFDLGDDPLAYYRKRLQLSRELWDRVQSRRPEPGDDVLRQRRVLISGFRQLGRAAELAGKYVGGMVTQRDLPGSGRPAYTPVAPARQREALQFLTQGLFTADAFRFEPQFLASLSPDYREWDRGGPVSIPAAVLQVQTVALDRLLSAGTAQRLLDLPLYLQANQRQNIISLAEVYGSLQGAVWSELKAGREIDRLRRNLQREHLKRVQALLVRGSASLPPDALSLVRYHATALQAELQRAAANPAGLSIDSRAHVQDSLALLTEALRASMTRG